MVLVYFWLGSHGRIHGGAGSHICPVGSIREIRAKHFHHGCVAYLSRLQPARQGSCGARCAPPGPSAPHCPRPGCEDAPQYFVMPLFYYTYLTGFLLCSVWLTAALADSSLTVARCSSWLVTAFFHGVFASFTYFMWSPSAGTCAAHPLLHVKKLALPSPPSLTLTRVTRCQARAPSGAR